MRSIHEAYPSAVVQPTVADVTSLFVALGMAGAAWLVAGGIAATEREMPPDPAPYGLAPTRSG